MVSKIDTAWNLFLEGKISEAKQLVEQDFSIDTCTDFSLLNLILCFQALSYNCFQYLQ